jgi:UbiA prenyltransferase family protein
MSLPGIVRMLRPPNVFTAFADALAGLLVVRASGLAVRDADCALILSSGLIYLAGLVLNDYFDREVDAAERPGRPIPSGDVSATTAAAIGVALLATGVGLACWVSQTAGAVATCLAAAVISYDALLKKTRLSPWSMGTCRALNFLLGLSPLLAAGAVPPIAWTGPILLGLYIVALTYIARDEVQGNSAQRARTGLLAIAALAAALVFAFALAPGPRPLWSWAWPVLVLARGYSNWSPLWHRQDGPTTGRAIGGGILLIPLLDATICAAAGEPFWALSVAALIVPARILKRWYSPT